MSIFLQTRTDAHLASVMRTLDVAAADLLGEMAQVGADEGRASKWLHRVERRYYECGWSLWVRYACRCRHCGPYGTRCLLDPHEGEGGHVF